MGKLCPTCKTPLVYSTYKDIINLEGIYFTVYLVACPECGYVNDEESYISQL
jgi:RNase P subunit RPR2